MAGQADGSIIVDTELDSEGFRAGSKELQTAVKSLNKQVGSLGPTFNKALRGNEKAMESFDLKASALEDTIAEVEAKMESLGNQRGPTKEYTALQKKLEQADLAVDRLYQRMEKMSATGVKENSKAWKSLQYDIQQAQARAASYDERIRAMEADGTAYTTGADTSAYQQLAASLEVAKNKLFQMRTSFDLTPLQRMLLVVKNAAVSLGDAVRSLPGKLGKLAVSGFGLLAKKTLQAINPLRLFNRQSGSCTKAITKLTKKVGSLWMMFRARVLRSLIMGAFNSLKDGVNNLAQYSTEANKNMSALKSGLTQLKNSFATAFSPILSVATPALLTLINYLSQALTYIGMLVAALSGAKTFTKATAVQEDYAKSLESTGKAAQKAKRQLASFDDLNILSDNATDGAGGTAAIEDMFETVPITTKITDFVSELKAAIAAKDFDFLGEMLGNKINAGVQKIRDFIHWDSLGGKITEGITAFTSTLNSLVDTVDWWLLGDTVAQGFNTIVKSIYTFFSTTDWRSIGNALANSINGALNGIDWAALAQTMSVFAVSLLTAAVAFIEQLDWQQIAVAVITFIGNIDWGGIVSGLAGFAGALAGGLLQLAVSAIREVAASVGEYFRACSEEIGGNGIEGFFYGIVKALASIGTWIVDNIFKPFIEGFKNAFGIHSPSTVMAEQGGFIIQGLLNGIKTAWTAIPQFIWSALNDVETKLRDCWVKVKSYTGQAWDNIKSTLTTKLSSVQNTLNNTFSNLKTRAVTWGKDICSNLANGIKNGLSTVGNAVKGVAEKIKSLIGFSEPEDGPLSNFHTYMPDMLDLMAEGIKANEYKAVNAVAGVASAISDEVQGGNYSIGGIGVGSVTGLSRQLTSVAAMMDAANAVANSAAYRAPAVAVGSVAPYEVTARVEGSDSGSTEALVASNDALGVVFAQVIAEAVRAIVAAIEANGGGEGAYDTREITTAVINEINRRSRVAGRTPLLI